MSSEKIKVTRNGAAAIITINRPEVYNAMDRECWVMLRQIVQELDADSSVRVIIITGAGEKSFIAGADINALRKRSAIETLRGENGKTALAVEQCTKPTIAAINGLALGGGCEIALACDLRIAAGNAKIGLTELNVGILPGAGGTQRLTQIVGLGRAMHMILTGEPIKAGEALACGLVTAVVPLEDLIKEALTTAEKLMKKSPITVQLAKTAVREGAKTNLSTALLLETLCQSVIFGTDDHMEGLTAFLEKRTPVYKGE